VSRRYFVTPLILTLAILPLALSAQEDKVACRIIYVPTEEVVVESKLDHVRQSAKARIRR